MIAKFRTHDTATTSQAATHRSAILVRAPAFVASLSLVVMGLLVGCHTATKVAGSSPSRSASNPQLSLQEQVTCGGCPLAEGGAKLLRDLGIAKEVNLNLSDLPNGSRQIAPPPSPRGDRPFGIIDRGAALRFASCMRLPAGQRSNVLNNADQVLNVGSPVFGIIAPGVTARSGPSQLVIVQSWVDMTSTAAQAAGDIDAYFSPRYASCATEFWKALAKQHTGRSKPSEHFAAIGRTAGWRTLQVRTYRASVPGPRKALVIDRYLADSGESAWEGLVVSGRVEATITVGPVGPGPDRGFSPLDLVQSLLAIIARRSPS